MATYDDLQTWLDAACDEFTKALERNPNIKRVIRDVLVRLVALPDWPIRYNLLFGDFLPELLGKKGSLFFSNYVRLGPPPEEYKLNLKAEDVEFLEEIRLMYAYDFEKADGFLRDPMGIAYIRLGKDVEARSTVIHIVRNDGKSLNLVVKPEDLPVLITSLEKLQEVVKEVHKGEDSKSSKEKEELKDSEVE